MKKKDHTELDRDAESVVHFLPKIKIGIVVANEKLTTPLIQYVKQTEPNIEEMENICFSIDDAVHISTGISGIDAL